MKDELAATTKELNWLEIVGISAFAALLYALIPLLSEMYFPPLLELSQNLAHLVITLVVIIVIRKIEIPRIEKEKKESIDLITSKYDELSNDNEKKHNDLRMGMQSKYDNLLSLSLPLLDSATKIGLTHVHKTRNDAKSSIDRAIKATKGTLHMLGVALEETFSINKEYGSIANHIVSNMQDGSVRFLCLNPFTTPAVIRSFLESYPNSVKSFLGKEKIRQKTVNGIEIPDGIVIFTQTSTLFSDFRKSYSSFSRFKDENVKCEVKYYRRDPTAWILITDDRIFFEPYTFGQPNVGPNEHRDSLRIGGRMPVFEFDRTNRTVCSILEDHFERLWRMSKDDLSTLENVSEDLDNAAEKFYADVFKIRWNILESLGELLNDPNYLSEVQRPRRDTVRNGERSE